MAKLFFKRLYRFQTTTIAPQTSVLIKAIRCSPTGANDLTDTVNQAGQTSNSTNPVLIKSYRLEIATNFCGVVYQTIGDNDDFASGDMYDWAPADPDFMSMMKRHKLVAGGDLAGGTAPDAWFRTTLSYKGRPLKLRTPARPDGQTIVWAVENAHASDTRQFYANLTVKYVQLT